MNTFFNLQMSSLTARLIFITIFWSFSK